ncbi:MAG: hypothetical protein U1F46_10015 [Marinagarivorans sp.]
MRYMDKKFSILILCFMSVFSVAAEQPKWVAGSWVSIRKTIDATSPIVDHLVTNSAVNQINKNDKVCEISWAQQGRGFVPCEFLGDKPLQFSELLVKLDSAVPHRDSTPLRAFWLKPTAAGLFQAADYFHGTLLTDAQRQGEVGDSSAFAPGKLIRYAVPELEAMKSVLSKGIVAPAEAFVPLISCREIQSAQDKIKGDWEQVTSSWASQMRLQYPYSPYTSFRGPCRVSGVPKLNLPTVKPSFFTNAAQLASGDATVEELSARFGILEKGRVLGGPRWELDYDAYRYTGAWDIGKYELQLTQPIYEHVIGRNGLIGVYRWQPKSIITPNGVSSYCVEGLRNKRMGKELVPGYPAVKGDLFWFQTNTALPFKSAKISRAVVMAPENKNADPSLQLANKVAVYEIDINSDGIVDFVQWDAWGKPQIAGPDPLLVSRRVFVNISGIWYPLSMDGYGECT